MILAGLDWGRDITRDGGRDRYMNRGWAVDGDRAWDRDRDKDRDRDRDRDGAGLGLGLGTGIGIGIWIWIWII